MINTIDRWIWKRLEQSGFKSESEVRRFSLFYASLVTAVVFVLPTIGFVALDQFGFLPIPLVQAIAARSFVSVFLGLPIAFVVIYSLSLVIYRISLMRAEFEQLSRTDMLSGLLNRRAFSQALDEIRFDASIVIFDVDRFKSINDRFGHLAGDTVIRKVASTIAEIIGPDQIVARIGGEEFGIIISGLPAQQRLDLVNHTRMHIENMVIEVNGSEIRTTISAGMAELSAKGDNHAQFAAADRALYAAKAAGRNRIMHGSQLQGSHVAA